MSGFLPRTAMKESIAGREPPTASTWRRKRSPEFGVEQPAVRFEEGEDVQGEDFRP